MKEKKNCIIYNFGFKYITLSFIQQNKTLSKEVGNNLEE